MLIATECAFSYCILTNFRRRWYASGVLVIIEGRFCPESTKAGDTLCAT
jgi:hypothetical protein